MQKNTIKRHAAMWQCTEKNMIKMHAAMWQSRERTSSKGIQIRAIEATQLSDPSCNLWQLVANLVTKRNAT